MTVFTVHELGTHQAVLVPERFSLAAFVFGPLWLLAQRAWIAAILAFAALVAVGVLPNADLRWLGWGAVAWLLGLHGQDLRRWALARRGYRLAGVVTGADTDSALGRLLVRRPDLIAGFR